MRFLSIYKTAERNTPPTAEEMARMGKLIEQGMSEGWLLATEGWQSSATGARVRRSGDRITVTDGPFTEAKELIAGYAMLQADSKDEAVELCKRFLAQTGDGECEVRPMHDAGGDSCAGQESTVQGADARA